VLEFFFFFSCVAAFNHFQQQREKAEIAEAAALHLVGSWN